jgi:hypothetical protein
MPVENKIRATRRFQNKVEETKQNFEDSPLNGLCSWDAFARLNAMEMKSIQVLMKDMIKMKSKQRELELDDEDVFRPQRGQDVLGEVPPNEEKVVPVQQKPIIIVPIEDDKTNEKENEKENENIILDLPEVITLDVVPPETIIVVPEVIILDMVPPETIIMVPTEDEDLSEDEEEYAQYLLIREQDVLTPEEFEIYLKHHTRDGMPLSDDDKLFLRDMRGYA